MENQFKSEKQLSNEDRKILKSSLKDSSKIDLMSDKFEYLVLKQSLYVDKSMLLMEIFKDGHQFITAPTRWGKSINLSMIKTFLQPDTEDSDNFEDGKFIFKKNRNRVLFEGGTFLRDKIIIEIPALQISKQTVFFNENQGQYPVILLNFQDVNNFNTLEELKFKLGVSISEAFQYHSYIFKNELISILQRQILNKNIQNIQIETLNTLNFRQLKQIFDENKLIIGTEIKQYFAYYDNDYSKYLIEYSIKFLKDMLFEFFDKKVYILVDEFDRPVLSLIHDYLSSIHDSKQQKEKKQFLMKVIRLVTSIVEPVFKSESETQVILTGITNTVFKEISSGCSSLNENNIFASRTLSQLFGFTSQDIDGIIKKLFQPKQNIDIQIQKLKELLKYWYNGHNVSNLELYNPYSIMKYFSNCLNSDDYFNFDCFWVNTFDQNTLKIILEYNLYTNNNISEYLETLSLVFENKPQNLLFDRNHTLVKLIFEFNYQQEQVIALFNHILIKQGFLTRLNMLQNNNEADYLYKFPSLEIRLLIHQIIQDKWFKKLGMNKAQQIDFQNMAFSIDFYNDSNYAIQEKLEQCCQIFFNNYEANLCELTVQDCITNVIRMSKGFVLNGYITEQYKHSGQGFSDFSIYFNDRVDLYELKNDYNISDDRAQEVLEKALQQIINKNYKDAVLKRIKNYNLNIKTIRLIPIIIYKRNNDHNFVCKIGNKITYSISQNSFLNEKEINFIQQMLSKKKEEKALEHRLKKRAEILNRNRSKSQ